MLSADFSDAIVKLNRAKQHISDVEASIKSFLVTKFYELRIETDQGTGRMKLVLHPLGEPDKRLNAVVGDAIGNLRSVLDYIFYTVTSPVTGVKDRGYFPMADDANGFAGEVKKGAIGTCADPFIALFIDKVQAYKGGVGESLWALNKLRNIDKHRLLVSTVAMTSVRLSMKCHGMTFVRTRFGVSKESDSVLLDAPVGEINFTAEPQPSFEIRINEPPDVENREVIGLLHSGVERIEALLDALKILCV